MPKPPPRFGGDGDYTGLFTVPLADVRILILSKSSDGNPLVAADAQDPAQVAVGIETHRGLLVRALLTAG